jgi:hypothetical protein
LEARVTMRVTKPAFGVLRKKTDDAVSGGAETK